MRRFVDLCLNPPLNDPKVIEEISKFSKLIEFNLVGIVFDERSSENQISRIIEPFKTLGIDVVKRIDLAPKSRLELLQDLRKFRGKYEILSVNCLNTQVSVVASRDRRVDIVSIGYRISMFNIRKMINRIVNKPLEIKLSEILNPPNPRKFVLRRLHEEIFTAKKNKVPVIISSGAKNHLMLRSPRDMAAVGMLLGLESDDALDSVSKIPYSIVERNREKLSSKWIAEGVQIHRGSIN